MVVLNIGKQLFPFPHCDTSFPLSHHHVSFKPEWKQQVVKPHRSYVHCTVVFTLLPTAHARSLNPSLTLALCFLIRFISCWGTHTPIHVYLQKHAVTKRSNNVKPQHTKSSMFRFRCKLCSLSLCRWRYYIQPPLWYTLLPVGMSIVNGKFTTLTHTHTLSFSRSQIYHSV